MLSPVEMMSYLCSTPQKRQVALLASENQESPFFAGERGRLIFEEPVANILQKEHSIDDPEKRAIYLSYPPSPLELGMIWRAEIPHVYYVNNKLPGEIIHEYHITPNGYGESSSSGVTTASYDSDELTEIEEREPRITPAMDDPINSRQLQSAVTEHLRRGLIESRDIEIDTALSPRKIDEDFIRVVLSLVDRSWNSKDKTIKPLERVAGNNIGAIMVDKDNQIIGWGLNYKGNNKTLHAETMMIQHYLRENNLDRLPEGAKIYTSLQCCPMCAGHIATLGDNIKVIYAQKDPYFTGKTAIDEGVALNGCIERPTTLAIRDIFASEVGKQQILDFLFGLHPDPNEREAGKSLPTRELFARTLRDVELFDELAAVVSSRNQELLASARNLDVDFHSLTEDLNASSAKKGAASINPSPTLSVISDESLDSNSSRSRSSSSVIEKGNAFLDSLGEIAPSSPEVDIHSPIKAFKRFKQNADAFKDAGKSDSDDDSLNGGNEFR